MRALQLLFRCIICWYFGLLSMIFVAITFRGVQDASRTPANRLAIYSFSSLLAIIFGMASWTAWRERASARARGVNGRKWMVTACLLSLLISIYIPVLYYYAEGPGAFWSLERALGVVTIISVAGLVAFSLPDRQPSIPPDSKTKN